MDDDVALLATHDNLLATDVYAEGDGGDGGSRGVVHYGGGSSNEGSEL